MFPLHANEPYIKETGERSTLGDMFGSGPDIPEYSDTDNGKVLSVDEQGDLEWKQPTSELPNYSVADAGHVLGVDDEGLLEWNEMSQGGKIYYKDFSISFNTHTPLGESGFYIHTMNASPGKDAYKVTGYTVIGSMLEEAYSGYQVFGGIPLSSNGAVEYVRPFAISQSSSNSASKLRVFYVKSENIEQLT